METLLNNKKFIKASIIFVALLSLLTIAKFINEVKTSDYIGRGNQPANVISVSGKGEVNAPSDIASLSMTISKDASTTKEAQNLLNISITKTLAYLKTQKIEDKDIKSEYGGVNPKYEYNQINCLMYPCPQPAPRISGYTATQNIVVKIRAVDSANDIRTGLANLGITNISGPDFTIDNQDALNDQARGLAIKDAQEKAKLLAKQLGVHLGKVSSFSENGGGYPMMYAKADMAMGSAGGQAPAPVLPKGENKIISNVSITYEIR